MVVRRRRVHTELRRAASRAEGYVTSFFCRPFKSWPAARTLSELQPHTAISPFSEIEENFSDLPSHQKDQGVAQDLPGEICVSNAVPSKCCQPQPR